MKIYLQANVSPDQIMRNRGLGDNGEVAKFMAREVRDLSDPYVPMSATAGVHMKDQATIAGGGKYLIYHGPYAHYQHEGKVMGPNVLFPDIGWRSMAPKGGKYYTGKMLSYHDSPTRGDHWEERMMADRGEELERHIEEHIKELGK